MKQQTETDFLQQVCEQLDAQNATLDEASADRLYMARRQAMAHYHQQAQKQMAYAKVPGATLVLHYFGQATSHWKAMSLLASIALVCVLTLVMWQQQPMLQQADAVQSPIADLEILAANESPDFYEELEFYTWLADEHTY